MTAGWQRKDKNHETSCKLTAHCEKQKSKFLCNFLCNIDKLQHIEMLHEAIVLATQCRCIESFKKQNCLQSKKKSCELQGFVKTFFVDCKTFFTVKPFVNCKTFFVNCKTFFINCKTFFINCKTFFVDCKTFC